MDHPKEDSVSISETPGQHPPGDLEQFYLDLLENQSAGIYRIRVKPTGEWSAIEDPVYAYEYMNDRYCEITGFSREELTRNPGKTMAQIHPDHFEEFVRLNEEARVTKKNFQWTGRIIRKDETRWVRFESRPRTLADGHTLWTGMLTDLTEQKATEQALLEKTALIQSVSEGLATAMIYQVVSDRRGGRKFTYVSDSVTSFYGCTPAEAIDDPLLIYGRIHPEDQTKLLEAEKTADRLLQPFRFEARVYNPEGILRWSYFTSTYRLLEDGRTCWSGIEIDITERKKAVEALQRQLRYEEAIALASACLLKPDAGYETVNEAIAHLRLATNASRVYLFENVDDPADGLCARQTHESCGPGVRPEIDNPLLRQAPYARGMECWREQLSRGIPVCGHARDFPEGERNLLEAQGVISILVLPLIVNGRWNGFIGFDEVHSRREWHKEEISLLKTAADMLGGFLTRLRTREILREKNTLLQNINDHLVDLLSMATLEGVLTYVSRSHDVLGYTPEQLLGTTATDLVHPEDHHFVIQKLAAILDNPMPGKQASVEYRYRCADGSYRWLETLGKCLFTDKGEPYALFFSGRDITERRRAEEARQRIRTLEGLGTVAGGLAHDFNNLLTGVFGNIELAQIRLRPDHPALAVLQTAHRALGQARHLTSRLLTFAKGGQPILEKVDLRQHIRDTVTFHLAGGNVAARFDLPADLWPAKADKGQLAEVIANLTINARESMPAGGTLHVQARNVADVRQPDAPDLSGDCVQLIFRDEGTGIPASIIDRIFEPYFTTKRVGSGLGLAIVHGIICKHNGHITIESAPDKGTVFTLFLPADMAEHAGRTATPLPPGESARVSGRILFMDDDPLVRKTATHMLESLGYAVETAADGREALEAYAAAMKNGQPFDLTIMDLTIPGGMGGKEAIGELLALDPSARVIVATGYFSDPVLASYADYGFCGSLPKPFSLKDLKEITFLALNT